MNFTEENKIIEEHTAKILDILYNSRDPQKITEVLSNLFILGYSYGAERQRLVLNNQFKIEDIKVVIKRGDFEIVDKEKEFIYMGGDSSNPSWESYLQNFSEEYKLRMIAIKNLLFELGLVGTTADNFCNNTYFEFNDGVKIAFTWRAWGDLMQAIVNKREGYMKYYC